jgi:tetratricopeptide (TPR) repeat protein
VENNLGVVYLGRRDYEKAGNLFQQAIGGIFPILQKEPDNGEYEAEAAFYYNNLAQALSESNITAARKANDNARELIKKVDKPNPALDVLRAKVAEWSKYLAKH